MQSCWTAEPSKRALLGDVRQRLEKVLQQATTSRQSDLYTLEDRVEDGVNWFLLSDAESIASACVFNWTDSFIVNRYRVL